MPDNTLSTSYRAISRNGASVWHIRVVYVAPAMAYPPKCYSGGHAGIVATITDDGEAYQGLQDSAGDLDAGQDFEVMGIANSDRNAVVAITAQCVGPVKTIGHTSTDAGEDVGYEGETVAIRRVKCDENKPSCQKCVSTGRTCDGYNSSFKILTTRSPHNTRAGGFKSGAVFSMQPNWATLTKIAPQDICLLNRYFSTKTIVDVSIELSCTEEARQVLLASLTDPHIRHAVSSLRALREQLEVSGIFAASIAQMDHGNGYEYGLQHYCMALGGLASNLSAPNSHRLKSALLCCQIFISIEQVRGNYAAMSQHLIQGLSIMHEYRARPAFVFSNKLIPAHHNQLPLLDVFIIKLFSAPCKFSDPPVTADTSEAEIFRPSASPEQQNGASCKLRTIAPDMRTKLTRIAASTLELLGKVSHVKSAENALRLLPEKSYLMDSLELWLAEFELVQTTSGRGLLSQFFLRLFHQILHIILLGALDSSLDLYARLHTENDRLKGIASNIDERLQAYRARSGTRNGRGG
ncbi:hypothetical protein G7046_g1843 [Stylonectria norvegica]|nr:hypothetical protein G7046_g1843 [Stylonectria norvegica]